MSRNSKKIAELRQGADNLRARAARTSQAGDPVQSERDNRTARLLDQDADRAESGQADAEHAESTRLIRRYFD
ncbi:hypothetical protein [Streptomyces sp.]|uniref:hypothetical protein n=1 Tax=Streptomyces sp. TaxID=1931 RepID=UPI002F91C5BB